MIGVVEIVAAALIPAVVVLAAVLFVVRLIGRLRRHHPIANRRFMARYRAEHPTVSRATVDAASGPGAFAVVRRRTPAGAEPSSAKPSAPAGPGGRR